MTNNDDSYNQRQFNLMLQKINFYRSNQYDLNNLILDLEALLYCLKDISPDWKNNFIKAWSILEYVYSFMAYENRKTPNEKEISSINKALAKIIKLINDVIKNDE